MATTTVEIRNQIPFPIKVFRKPAKGDESLCNLLDGYRRYVQDAASGDQLIVRLACAPQWELARINVGDLSQTCVIGSEVLKSHSGTQSVQVKLDLPVRNVTLFTVDGQGQRKPLNAAVGGTCSVPDGTVIEARGAKDNFPYCWLIVTPQGQANILGQTFTMGTGWGVSPQIGEVALFLDLALGKDAAWQPTAAPATPFHVILHGDIGDLSTILGSSFADIATPLRTPTADLTAGTTAAKPSTLDQYLQQQPPAAAGARLKSAGPVLLKAAAGPGTRVVFYEQANLAGTSFIPDSTGKLPKDSKARSINLEVTQTTAEAGIKVFTTLSEDYEADAQGDLHSITRFRSTLVFPPGVKSVELSAWEDGTEIEVDDKKYTIGPIQPAKLTPNELGRLMVKLTAEEAGAPELLVRTDTMVPGTVVTVYPDQEMHEKIASMPDNALKQSGLVKASYSQDDCKQVQLALQSISQTMVHGYATTTDGVTTTRYVDASQMNDAHWVLNLDPGTGKVTYQAIDAGTAASINATASKEVQKVGSSLAQGFSLSKTFKKATKVVVSTGESVGKTVSNTATSAANTVANTATSTANTVAKTTTSAANTVANTATSAANTVAKATTDAANATADAVVSAANSVAKELVVTVHFLEDNVPGIQFVVNQAKHAAMAIKAVVQMIEVAVEKFVEWVRFLFEWKDIEESRRVIAKTIRNSIKGMSQNTLKLKNQIDKALEHAKTAIAKAESTAAVNSTTSGNIHHSWVEKLEWFMDVFRKNHHNATKDASSASSTSASSTSTSTTSTSTSTDSSKSLSAAQQFMADLKKAAGNIGKDLFGIEQSIERLAKAMGDGDINGVFVAAKDIACQLVTAGLDVIKAIVDILLDGVASLIDGVLWLLDSKIKIPVISKLFEKYLGIPAFSVLDLASLIIAIPVTIGTKLFTGKAPFSHVDSLAQGSSNEIEVGKTLALGVVSIVDGFLNAWTTMKATGAADGLSTPSKDPLGPTTIFKLITTVVKVFGYLGASLIFTHEGAIIMVDVVSGIRAYFQLRLFVFWNEPGFNQFEAAADAVVGAFKILAGVLETTTGHTLEGGIGIIEGAGKLAVLGGFSEVPPVIVAAVVVSVASAWTAAGLYFVRAAKL